MSTLEYLQDIYKRLQSGSSYDSAILDLCEVANNGVDNNLEKQLLYDCFIASRIYGYLDTAERYDPNFYEGIHQSVSDFVPISIYGSEVIDDIVLTKQQKDALNFFEENKRVCISAPTSFGKTFILFEILALNTDQYNNILIVVPTIALSLEIYHKLKKHPILSQYTVINTTQFEFSESEKHIFVFTPEKTDLFLDENNVTLDFFAIDEVYKINNRDDRSNYFDYILHRLVTSVNHCYLIGPYIDSFAPNLCEKYNIRFKKYETEIVQKIVYGLSKTNFHGNIGDIKINKSDSKKKKVSRVINNSEGQCLIYAGRSKGVVEKLVRDIIEDENWNYSIDENMETFIDYLGTNYHRDWILPIGLQYGVAFHHGGMPKYIQKEIIDKFNEGSIRVIVCTSTIVEGVNTSAKNVILYDHYKGEKSKLSDFDRKNIHGRAGRFIEHFVGYIYDLDDGFEASDNATITSEYADLNTLENEKFLLVDEELYKDNPVLSERKQALETSINTGPIELVLGLYEVVKKNKFIPYVDQVNLVNKLITSDELLQSCYIPESYKSTTRTEAYKNIYKLIDQYLFTERYSKKRGVLHNNENIRQKEANISWSISYIIDGEKKFISNYIGFQASKEDSNINGVIRSLFVRLSEQFSFVLPRYLKVFENLYNAVAKHKGRQEISLDAIIKKLEFGYDEKHNILLSSLGVPNIIIDKVSSNFDGCDSYSQIEQRYNQVKNNLSISNIEKGFLDKNLT